MRYTGSPEMSWRGGNVDTESDVDIMHYSMIIQWSIEDQVYVVNVPELPGCKTHGNTYEEAVKQGQDAIESWIIVAQELGRSIPLPRVLIA
jgi:predicted RNase H-like HicB family nuclease